MSQAICEVRWLGRQPYLPVRELQEWLAGEIAAGRAPATLLLLEHPHTYTFGRRVKPSNLLWSEAKLRQRGVEVHWIDRGGDVTYHGPGQLVGYPLLPLGTVQSNGHLPQADYVGYVRRLEQVMIRALADLGLASGQVPGATGVWVQPNVASRCPHCPPAARKLPSKIAAIGVRVDARGISRHGFALNLHPDMEYWNGIIACDLPEHPVISLADLLDPVPTLAQARAAVIQAFGRVFSFEMREVRQTELPRI